MLESPSEGKIEQTSEEEGGIGEQEWGSCVCVCKNRGISQFMGTPSTWGIWRLKWPPIASQVGLPMEGGVMNPTKKLSVQSLSCLQDVQGKDNRD